ncbi:hypothetical protein MTR67_030795 [Solanum verrucosum]|uniref:Uncharacterized protein n=1 Tax=Solanum verrucosum TaxID=315347 RepID=A0AAF0U199_SOLVR|nr:hypothetical protein MTR67_030795 [Solanum verrucosum]
MLPLWNKFTPGHRCKPGTFAHLELIHGVGIQWLASLNTIQANWNEMFLIFQLNVKTYKLKGIPQKALTPTFFQSDLEEQILPRDAMLNLIKEDYKHIDLSSNVGDASILRLQPYGQLTLLAVHFLDFHLEHK